MNIIIGIIILLDMCNKLPKKNPRVYNEPLQLHIDIPFALRPIPTKTKFADTFENTSYK